MGAKDSKQSCISYEDSLKRGLKKIEKIWMVEFLGNLKKF
jgi:hypothetical protein